MSPTPIRDPNMPGDPAELRDIPDQQHPAGQDANAHNPVTPGAPPSPEYPTGVPPIHSEAPPTQPPIEPGPPVVGNIIKLKAVDADTGSIQLSQAHYVLFADGDLVVIDGTGTAVDGDSVQLENGNGTDTYECGLAVPKTASQGTITKGAAQEPAKKKKETAKKK